MKALISACALCGLIWLPAAGQRAAAGGGFARPAPPVGTGTIGIPPLGTLPPMGGTVPTVIRRPGRGLGGGYGYGYWFPGAYDGYPADNSAQQAAPSLVVVTPETLMPAMPPRPVQGEVRDYTKTNPPETAQGPPAEFAVVGKDHVAHSAVAVWAQDNMLHYIDPDGAAAKMPLDAVDREATRLANAAKGLRLQLSAE